MLASATRLPGPVALHAIDAGALLNALVYGSRQLLLFSLKGYVLRLNAEFLLVEMLVSRENEPSLL